MKIEAAVERTVTLANEMMKKPLRTFEKVIALIGSGECTVAEAEKVISTYELLRQLKKMEKKGIGVKLRTAA